MTNRVPSKATLLSAAAKRVSDNPLFMGSLIWSNHGTFNLPGIAAELGADEASVVALALCRRPRTSPEYFAKDVRAIAAYSGISEERIAAIVRRADALAALRSDGAELLMAAARDKIDPPPTPPSGEP